jgi:anti-anti-sigma regulatory factor
MTRTRFCDSAGLHALLGAHKRARAEGRQVRLAVTGTQVRRILALPHPPAARGRAAREQGR